MKRIIRIVLLLGLLGMPLVYLGCGAASSPVPPVETPSPIVLKFIEPSNLSVNLDTVSPSISALKVVNPGDDVSPIIQGGPYLVNLIDSMFFIPAFTSISALEIPVGATTTTFAADDFNFPAGSGVAAYLEGVHDVYIDFADFDFDNNGSLEGCSGSTAPPLPVCARMMLDGVPYLEWIWDEYPFDTSDPNAPIGQATIGKGRFKIYIADLDGYETQFAYNYEQVTPPSQQRNVETFMIARNLFTECIGTFCFHGFKWHIETSQVGPEASAFKGINIDSCTDDSLETDPFDVGYICGNTSVCPGYPDSCPRNYLQGDYRFQYIEGQSIAGEVVGRPDVTQIHPWAGSILTSGRGLSDFDPKDECKICADITTGIAVDLGFCDTAGIIDGIYHLDTASVQYVCDPDQYLDAVTCQDVKMGTATPSWTCP